MAEGASGVFATPLTAVPDPFPAPDEHLQTAVDAWQARLDEVPGEAERAAWLRAVAQRGSAVAGQAVGGSSGM